MKAAQTYMTVAEAAQYIRVSKSWLEKHSTANNMVIGCIKRGKNKVFKKVDLDNYMESLYQKAIAV